MTKATEPLDRTLAKWFVALDGVLSAGTIKGYEGYAGKHWTMFSTLDDMLGAAKLGDYARKRLRGATRKTLRKELGALFGFLTWCKEQGYIDMVPERPELPRRAMGVRVAAHRARANELSPAHVEALLTALPEWSDTSRGKERFAVRARFEFAYETGLRPSTVDRLEWDDYHGSSLTIRDEIDKARFGRELPLSRRAVQAIVKVAPAGGTLHGRGLIFGKHDYRTAIAKAAAVAVPGVKVAPYDLRHARTTHELDAGASLLGVGFLRGHRLATTTNNYARQTERSGQAVVDVMSDSGSDWDPPDGGGGAKEGNRTPTGITPPEPEAVDVLELSPERADVSHQRTSSNRRVSPCVGSRDPGLPPWAREASGVLMGLAMARGVEVSA